MEMKKNNFDPWRRDWARNCGFGYSGIEQPGFFSSRDGG
jgi:hypothetical protein